MNRKYRFFSFVACVALLAVMFTAFAYADTDVKAANSNQASYAIEDNNPAIYVAQRNADSVVGVIVNAESQSYGSREVTMEPVSEGSGVVIDDNGYIITNYHVVSDGDQFEILMPGGELVEAELIGYDSSVDLAVLKVSDEDAKKLYPAAIGDVKRLFVGSTVIAIGNPGGQTLSNTVTSGIVSCLERQVDASNTSRTVDYIQHDAPISSGNSGGGLFDVNGNLVGINTLKYGNSYYTSGSYEGLGFAIPIDYAYDIAVQIIEEGRVRRLGIGVTVREVNGAEEPTEEEVPTGLYVVAVTEDGPADRAGILAEDFIIGINGNRVHSMEDLTDVTDASQEGDVVTVTVARYTEADDDESEGMFGGFNKTSNSSDNYGNYYGFPYGSYGFPFGGFGFPFGGYGDYEDYYSPQYPEYELEIIDFEVQLEYLN